MIYPNVKTQFPLTCVALDSETFSLEEDAVVTEIAVVKFKLAIGTSGRLERSSIDEQVFHFNVVEQVALGRVIDKNTYDFHIKNGGHESIASQVIPGLEGPTTSLHKLQMLQEFCESADEVWINGMSFDPPVLRSLATSYGFRSKYSLNSLWHYRKERDCRTIYRTFPMATPNGSSTHRALDDAKWVEQIVHLYHQGVCDYLAYLLSQQLEVTTIGDTSANNG